MQVTLDNVQDFVRGAAFLGTGGGGDPYIGSLMLKHELRHGRTIDIIDPARLGDDDLIVSCATMGAPTVMMERIPSTAATVRAIERTENLLGRKAAAIAPIEAGGINATLPLAVAARMGRPVVDADGMGRAFPELQMVTYSVYGCSASPVVLTTERGDCMVVEADDNRRCEHLARSLVVTTGGQAQIALYPVLGRTLKEFAVLRTLSLALQIGATLSASRRARQSPVEALMTFFQSAELNRFARCVFTGKVSDVARKTTRGFAVGRICIEHLRADGPPCHIEFQNEFLMATRGGRPLAMVPDLICLLDAENGEPITTEVVRYGHRVQVFAVAVPPVMQTQAALSIFGPRAFGFDLDYIPLKTLANADPTLPPTQG